MCGIAGGIFWGGTSNAVAQGAVSAMVKALSHRGPDGRGIHCSASANAGAGAPFVVLGHTRLAIIDTTDAGAQPMGRLRFASRSAAAACDASAGQELTWITYNGETYNFRELKTELERSGARFQTRSDTEVLLRAYDAWGVDLLT